MVTQRYMTGQPRPPGTAKRFIDQRIVPAAIDIAAQMETGAERLSLATRAQPVAVFTAVFGLAFLAAHMRGLRGKV